MEHDVIEFDPLASVNFIKDLMWFTLPRLHLPRLFHC